MRVILFGYDTTLRGNHSFKSPYDIANQLITQMVDGGWSEPSAKPLFFLAHSLGGIVFKQVSTFPTFKQLLLEHTDAMHLGRQANLRP